ncbi:hypothetical protein CEXT_51001 [Caerostris extrusa]|uniref:Uncharacterized protein n=1 Tax=Caerostris extrusa TaxID=172846 RepID=A0AAV4RMZ5_CAEEX|nr:hypothetical protein CEXT_51001 [Caerostris extrusa]
MHRAQVKENTCKIAWKKSTGLNNKMPQVSLTGSLVITQDEPLLRAITPSSSDCFMEMLMSVNGSGIVALTLLDEIEETDHLLREEILLFLKVAFYSYWGCTYAVFFSFFWL